jgi:hypothetical protein
MVPGNLAENGKFEGNLEQGVVYARYGPGRATNPPLHHVLGSIFYK